MAINQESTVNRLLKKCLSVRQIVIPAKAGIQNLLNLQDSGFPLKTCGNDTYSYFRVFQQPVKGQESGVKRYITDKRGMTLIEVLIALTILAIGLLGVALMQVTSISGNVFGREMAVATELGQDLLEKIRSVDSTCAAPHDFLRTVAHPDATDIGTGLVVANTINELGVNVGPGPQYTRTWAVDACGTAPNPANAQNITVTVSWTDKTGNAHSVILTGVKLNS